MDKIYKSGKVILQARIITKIDSDLYAVTWQDNPMEALWQLFDYKKEILYPNKFFNMYPFYNDVACVITRKKPEYKYNFINKTAEFMFPIDFDIIEKKFFEKPVMIAFICNKIIKISLTGGIDLAKKELAKLLLAGGA